MKRRGDITCSVGVLTYNSERFLERCLKSLDDFAEIVIADGGSTDKTLEIARRYGCTIISQSSSGRPIEDFSLERNRMLDVASHDWFFYLDSDEIISDELTKEMREICAQKHPQFLIYKVPYQLVSEDLRVKYRSFKTYYQCRFFNKKSGARFVRKVHEKIDFDEKKYPAGSVRGAWYVPLDVQLDFVVYRAKVERRIGIMASAWEPRGFRDFLSRVVYAPLRDMVKQIIKMSYLRIRYRSSEIVPLRYEFFRLYSQCLLVEKFMKRYIKSTWRIKTSHKK